jgi:hypothetical protein
MRLTLPYINALQLLEIAPAQIRQYQSYHMDDWMLQNRLNQWQSGSYASPWLRSDSIYLQVQTNTGQPTITVIDCNGAIVIGPQLMIQRQQNPYDPGTYIYESATSLNACQEGVQYWFKITTGSITLISEPVLIYEDYANSLLIQYKHRKFYADVIFETGIEMNMRIPGFLRSKPPAAKDTLYEDQILDETMIKSVPYRLWEIYMGAGVRVPDYMIDKLNRIFGCSSVRIDGRYYTKNEGFKWEQVDEEQNGTFFAYKGELREMINRNSKIIIPSTNTNEYVVIAGLVDLKGFADTSESASSNITQFD